MTYVNDVANQVIQHVMTATDSELADLSVSRLAYSFNIDRFKLSRQFKSHHHISLKEFLLREKMGRAKFLLAVDSNITVKEISKRIGFCSSDYFIRKFNQYYGLAPGRYRSYKCGLNTEVENR